MPPARLLENLTRLRAEITHLPPGTADQRKQARAAAMSMPLTHSVNSKTFETICAPGDPDGALLSQDVLSVKLNMDRKGTSEIVMGTTNDVFLYLSAFAYPDTSRGFLFRETFTPFKTATATPFDSGAFGKNFIPPTGTTGDERRRFKTENELPLPECREYLADQLERCFPNLEDYLWGAEHSCPTTGQRLPHLQGVDTQPKMDGRVRTHEIQAEERVPLRGSPYLEAVFVRNLNDSEMVRKSLGDVPCQFFDTPSPLSSMAGEFHELRKKCVEYILQRPGAA